jgi:hypothetical protein
MILNWKQLREECPLTLQLIEKKTGFIYNPAYQTLINDINDAIGFQHIEGFMDDHGWFLTVYPVDFPFWNGIISDTSGKQLFNNPDVFKGVTTRNHAKALLASTAIKYFEEQLKSMLVIDKNATWLTDEHLIGTAQIELDKIRLEHFTQDGLGLIETAEKIALLKRGDRAVVIKNRDELPYIGMILPC